MEQKLNAENYVMFDWMEDHVVWMNDYGDTETVARGSPRDLALQARRDQLEAAERDEEEVGR